PTEHADGGAALEPAQQSAPSAMVAPRVPVTPLHPQSASATPSPSSFSNAPSFTCPMHPEVHRRVPGKCPKCGMDLVPEPSGVAK
ncbi:MAG TPA: heavy metal-binding domain-containing protein, partial [Polyangiaceae bacterium]|nr:heavy metal-binding domain-containing protein [Polyangiaceae bacterium]